MTEKILKFSASWCSPCKLLTESLKVNEIGIPVEEIDIDVEEKLTAEYNIRSIPTLIYLKDGYEVSRIHGNKSIEDIKKWINNS